MSNNGTTAEQLFEQYKTEFDEKRAKNNAKKSRPSGELALTSKSSGAIMSNRAEIPLPVESRKGRKELEAEQFRRWRMYNDAQRAVMAQHVMVATTVHAQSQLNYLQAELTDCYYSGDRTDAMNEFMASVTAKCLATAEAGVFAILESLPKKLAEEL
jgi:hypothetical protein